MFAVAKSLKDSSAGSGEICSQSGCGQFRPGPEAPMNVGPETPWLVPNLRPIEHERHEKGLTHGVRGSSVNVPGHLVNSTRAVNSTGFYGL